MLAGTISTFGILTVATFGERANRNSAYFSAFAVGLLTVAVLFHLIPEAMHLAQMATGSAPDALSWVAIGFAAMVLIGIAVQTVFSRRDDGAALTFGYASIIALAAHSLLDGVIYAASFPDEPFTGWLATSGLLFHEFPEGVIAFVLLMTAGLGRVRSVLLAFLASAATTVAGTIGAYFALRQTGELPMWPMLGAAAGALIYVLIVHLGPHASNTPERRGYLFAAFGVIVGSVTLILRSTFGH